MAKADLTYKQRKLLLEIGAEYGVVAVELVRMSHHPIVRLITNDGLSVKTVFPCSPSDSVRGDKNKRAQIRNVLAKARAGEIRGITLP